MASKNLSFSSCGPTWSTVESKLISRSFQPFKRETQTLKINLNNPKTEPCCLYLVWSSSPPDDPKKTTVPLDLWMTSRFPLGFSYHPAPNPWFHVSHVVPSTTPDRTGFPASTAATSGSFKGLFFPKIWSNGSCISDLPQAFLEKKNGPYLCHHYRHKGYTSKKIDLLIVDDCWFIEILTHSLLCYYVYFLSTGEYNPPHVCLYGFGHCSLRTNDGSIDGFSCSLVDEARSVSDCGWKKSIYSNQLT